MKLLHLLNQTSYHFFFLAVDPFLTIRLPQLKNFHLLANYSAKNSGQLLSSPQTLKSIYRLCPQPNQAAIIPFKPSAKIDRICRQHHFLKISNPAPLSRQLEDKINFSQLIQKHQLPQPPFAIDKLQKFPHYQKKFGSPLVIQTRHGWAGKNSFLISNLSSLKNKLPLSTPVKFSPYLSNSYTLTNNCCLTPKGLIQSPPAVQFTGIKPLSSNPLATVGRQWPSFAPPAVEKKVKNISQKFSQILKKLNFKGFFGLDFLVHQNQVFLQECNPRLTASFAFYTQMEIKNQFQPLFFFHLLSFLPLKYSFNLRKENQRLFSPQIVGFQLNYKNQQGKTRKQINRFAVISRHLPPKINPLKLKW